VRAGRGARMRAGRGARAHVRINRPTGEIAVGSCPRQVLRNLPLYPQQRIVVHRSVDDAEREDGESKIVDESVAAVADETEEVKVVLLLSWRMGRMHRPTSSCSRDNFGASTYVVVSVILLGSSYDDSVQQVRKPA